MWDKRIQELIQFQQQYGHCEVPDDSKEYEDLSTWIRHLRSSFATWRNNNDEEEEDTEFKLTKERVADLQNLGLELSLLGPVHRGKRRLKELIAYKRLYGHHYRGPSGSADFPKLTEWLKKLRAAHEEREKDEVPILMDVQLSQLEKIGYDFNEFVPHQLGPRTGARRDSNEESWNRRVQELKEFKRAHGHFRVPSANKDYSSLYSWICDCRRDRRVNGEKSRVTDDRLLQLRSIGFDLMNVRNRVSRDEPNQEPNKFKEASGHCRPEFGQEHESQQSHCLKDVNKVSSTEAIQSLTEEVELLPEGGHEFAESTSSGSDPSSSNDKITKPNKSCSELSAHSHGIESWEDGIQRLKDLKGIHGHFTVPADSEEYKPLHQWLWTLQEDYNKLAKGKRSKRLTSVRITQLNRIGYYFGSVSSSPTVTECGSTKPSPECSKTSCERQFGSWFDKMLEELREFKKHHGHCRVPSEYRSLYQWTRKCCAMYSKHRSGEKGCLTDQEVSRLKDIGFDFPITWDDRVNQLSKFRELHGHFLVSRFTGKFQSLGLWVYNCQVDYQRIKRGEPARRLTSDLIEKLDAMGFDLERPFADDEIWNRGLQQLKEFILKFGHYKVPGNDAKYRSLSKWLRDSRSGYKKYKNGQRSQFTIDRVHQLLEVETLLKEDRISCTAKATGTPKVSKRRLPVVTPPHHSSTTMHQQREKESAEAANVQSPEQSHIESGNHASRIHHSPWKQRARAPTYSDGRKSGHNHGVDYPRDVLLSPWRNSDNGGRQSAQAPGYGHSPPTPANEGGMPALLDGLEEEIISVVGELNRRGQDQFACTGQPNRFWLDIGNRDGIDFFPPS